MIQLIGGDEILVTDVSAKLLAGNLLDLDGAARRPDQADAVSAETRVVNWRSGFKTGNLVQKLAAGGVIDQRRPFFCRGGHQLAAIGRKGGSHDLHPRRYCRRDLTSEDIGDADGLEVKRSCQAVAVRGEIQQGFILWQRDLLDHAQVSGV